MKPIRLFAPLFLSLLLAGTSLLGQVPDDYRKIESPPLRPFEVDQPVRVQLSNGMVIFLQQDRELPVLSGTAVVRGGGRDVDASKTGLIEVYSEVWRTGGTTARTGDELDDFLEMRAARVETGGDDDSTSISFDVLKESLDEVFPIWVDLLRNPAFREEKIELARRQINTGISRRNDSPGQIASREAARLLWGKDSPYARVAEYDTVAAVTREDLLAFHRRTVHPNNIIVGIVGDFDPKAMEARLRKAFGSWKRGPQVETPDIVPRPSRGLFLVPKDDVTQSTIVMVHPGTRKDDPDYYALQIMNEILGGGFSGRLVNRIRTQMGLAYSVGGGVGTGYDRPGAFQVSMGTRSDATLQAIDALYKEMEAIRAEPVTAEELSLARESLLNSYVFLIDSDEKILNQRMTLEFYGYPADFLERYRAGIETVTAADVQRVARKFVRPGELAVLVVGRPADFDRPLTSRGEVTTLDITIPEPGGAKEETPAATDDEGRAALLDFRSFMGGDALDAVRSVRTAADLEVQTPQGAMAISQSGVVVFADRKTARTMKLPMGEMTMVVTPDAAFMKTPMGVQDIPASQKKQIEEELWSDPLYLAIHAGDPGVKASVAGRESVGGTEARKVEVEAGGVRSTLWIASDGRLLQRGRRQSMAGESIEELTTYQDWGAVSGVRYATRVSVTANGEPRASGTVSSFEVNPPVDDSLFVKP